MRITIWVIPFSFVACGLVCGLSCPPGQFRSSVTGLCCNLCPAGHFMSKECQTSANDTQCSPCSSGTYNAKENKDTACRSCITSCRDQKETIVKYCSLASDIQCKCSDNYYRDPHSLQCKKCTSCIKKGQVLVSRCKEYKDAVCKTCGKGNFLLNNQCKPCDRCQKGEFVVEECSPKRNTVCRKLPKSTRPSSSSHIKSQEPVTGTEPVKRVDLNPTPAIIKAKKMFQDEIWVYRAVIMLLVLIILGLVLYKKIKLCRTIKTKVTTLKKGSDPKVVQRNESQSCREHLLELREKEKHIQNIERQVMELEEQVREKDEQQQNSQSHLTIFRGDGEKESVNFQKQFHLKLKELADLEKELRDCEQDNVVLQRELSTAKEKLSKCESLLTTREWLISRNEIEIMSEKFLGEGVYGKVFIGRYRGFVVAVKALKSLTFTPRERDLFEREMDIASRCRHPCLLQFIGATQGESPLFVTELMELSLRKLLGKRRLCGKEITTISLDVAHALNYLHQRKPKAIVHRDVSSANVLLWKQNDQWRGKLGDYGTVKFLQEIMTVDAGAMIYSAPEAGNPYNQTVKIDVYSFGILFCEMCTGNIPVLESREEQVRLVTNREFGGLILWCIEEDRTMRPNMEEVIKKLEQFQTISSYNCSGAVV